MEHYDDTINELTESVAIQANLLAQKHFITALKVVREQVQPELAEEAIEQS